MEKIEVKRQAELTGLRSGTTESDRGNDENETQKEVASEIEVDNENDEDGETGANSKNV